MQKKSALKVLGYSLAVAALAAVGVAKYHNSPVNVSKPDAAASERFSSPQSALSNFSHSVDGLVVDTTPQKAYSTLIDMMELSMYDLKTPSYTSEVARAVSVIKKEEKKGKNFGMGSSALFELLVASSGVSEAYAQLTPSHRAGKIISSWTNQLNAIPDSTYSSNSTSAYNGFLDSALRFNENPNLGTAEQMCNSNFNAFKYLFVGNRNLPEVLGLRTNFLDTTREADGYLNVFGYNFKDTNSVTHLEGLLHGRITMGKTTVNSGAFPYDALKETMVKNIQKLDINPGILTKN